MALVFMAQMRILPRRAESGALPERRSKCHV
jgi:hypothetical protein